MSVLFNGAVFPNTQSIALPATSVTKNQRVLTGMAWVKFQRLPTLDDMDILNYADGTDSVSHMRFKIKSFLGDSGRMSVGGTAPDGSTPLFFTTANPAITLNRWTHIAAVCDYDASFGYIYIDGDLFDSGPVNGTFSSTTSNTDSPRGCIGALSGGDSEGFQGWIEDVRLYSGHSPLAIKTIATLHGKDSAISSLLQKYPLTDLHTGNVVGAANVSGIDRGDGVGARNPQWTSDVITSVQKRVNRKTR